MAGERKIIGRKPCPWCEFENAHVKQGEGKHPYHHCPQCGYNVPARNGYQASLLMKGVRIEPGPDGIPQPVPADSRVEQIHAPGLVPKPAKPPADSAPKAPVQKPASWLDAILYPGGR